MRKNVRHRFVKSFLLLVLLFVNSTVLSKTAAASLNWPRKCAELSFGYGENDKEFLWREENRLYRMVSDRDVQSLRSFLKKNMLKGAIPVPVPHLLNASGVNVPGLFEPMESKKAIVDMNQRGEEVVRLLIWAGANPDEVETHVTKRTAIMRIVSDAPVIPKVSPRILRRLLAAGANPDLRDANGWTALMMAANNGSTDIARQLLAHGARRDFRNCAGQTAADIAKAKGHPKLEKLLRPRG